MSARTYLFGSLLPIKICGDHICPMQSQFLTKLADSLVPDPTATITHSNVVYLGIDEDKAKSPALQSIKQIFKMREIKCEDVFFEPSAGGNICAFWRILASAAYEGGCDFFGLLGDDVEMHDSNWIDKIIADFVEIHERLQLPDALFGFGCVALSDLKAPGFPTFPILHRIHIELNGEMFSDEFVNQDADPFVYQLYRRFGAARFCAQATLTNHIGGVQLTEDTTYVEPRYERYHVNWTNELLTQATERIANQLSARNVDNAKWLTVDVVVPTLRVNRRFLDGILSLKHASVNVDVQFIVIVDNPLADVSWLRALTESRGDLRVRVNPVNCGASHSRNVGLDESAAEYVLFLDDDVIPDRKIIDEYVKAVRENSGSFDGYVGYSSLPEVENGVFPTAVHMSGVSFFWRAARKMTRMPWGITANLFVRRAACPRFDVRYIKTGGGEDIAFCLGLKTQPLLSVPLAEITHPLWDGGNRCYKHFFNWSQSDGMLQDVYPELSYRTLPDAVETMVAVAVVSAALHRIPLGVCLVGGILAADVAMDFAHIYPDATVEPYSVGLVRALAVLESSLIKNASCAGRLWGHFKRCRMHTNFCKRFDWFCGQTAEVVRGEKRKAVFRFVGFAAAVAVTCAVGLGAGVGK